MSIKPFAEFRKCADWSLSIARIHFYFYFCEVSKMQTQNIWKKTTSCFLLISEKKKKMQYL